MSKELTEKDFYILLNNYSDNYYKGIPLIDDDEFDLLVKKYENLFDKKYEYLGKAEKSNKIKLPFYMGSLDKCKTNHQIDIFKNRLNENTELIITTKIDGISILFNLEKKILYTRGDGTIGSDVSNLIPYINIGYKKNKTILDNDLYIRGELVIFKDDFKAININNKYNNPRNLVAGLVNKYSSRINKGEIIEKEDLNLLSKINFIGYDILNKPNIKYVEKLSLINFITNCIKYDIVSKVNLTEEYLKSILIQTKLNCNYEIDGLVIKVNHIIHEETGKNPKYSIAFKNNNEGINTKIINVEWNITKNNILKPRIQIEPLIIDGSKIEYTTGFNAKYIFNNNLGPKSIITIVKSGDVIPYISNIIESTKPQMPYNDWEWVDNVDIKYSELNNSNKKDLFLIQIEYMFEIFNVKGLKMGYLIKLYDNNINTLKKLLQITKEELLKIEGIKDKLADKFISEIIILRKNMNDLCKVMVGSTIFPKFGEKKMEKILNEITYIKDNIILNIPINEKQLEDDLYKIGIKKNGNEFVEYLKTFLIYYKDIREFIIKDYNKNIEHIEEQNKFIIDINDKDICFSGFRDNKLKIALKQYNINVHDNINNKVTLLVVKDIKSNNTTKIDIAIGKNIKIITLEEFKNKIKF